MQATGSGYQVSQPSLSPKVSVIVPTYNHLSFLPTAVNSILAQTLADFELVIVNDGSTDGTRTYLDGLADSRIRTIHQENTGLPSALNTGFGAARGDLLTWVSADNFCSPMFLEALVGALDAHPDVGFAYSAYASVDEGGCILNVVKDQDISYRTLLAWNPGVASFLYRRECQERVGDYDPDLEGAEDWDMWLRILEKYGAVYIPEVLYYYRLHDRTMTATMHGRIRQACERTFNRALSRHGNELDIDVLYPSIRECQNPVLAKTHALHDFGTRLLRSPFDFQLDLARQLLETALSARSDSAATASNLAVAYGRLGQWDKAEKLREKLCCINHPEIRSVCQQIVHAHARNKPELLLKAPLFGPSPASPELCQIEEKSKRVFSLDIATKNVGARKDRAPDDPQKNSTRSTFNAEVSLQVQNAGRPLKITYLISSIVGITGGNQTLLKQANALVERGHQVTMVTYTDKPEWFHIKAHVTKVPRNQPMAQHVPPSDVVISTYFSNTAELLNVSAPVKMYYAQGDQYVFEDDTPSSNPDAETLRLRMREMSRASYLYPGVRFVANSHNLADAVARAYGRHADAVLPVCVDQTIFRPLQKPLRGSRWRILIVGPDSRGSDTEPLIFKGIDDIRQGLDLLSRRFTHLTAVRMSNSGPDIFKQFPCEFYYAPTDELKTFLYGTAHILVYASHYDSCPRPPQEAMAAGAAVICTATEGAMEYCRHEQNSLLIPIKSPEAIASALERLIMDDNLRERVIQGGFATAREFPREREWNELEDMLYRFLEQADQDRLPSEPDLIGRSLATRPVARDESNGTYTPEIDAPVEESSTQSLSAQQLMECILAPAEAAIKKGDIEGAAAEFAQLAENYPELAAAHAGLGSTLMALSRIDEALPSLRRAVELVPSAPDLHNQLGVALYKLDDLDGAEAAFQKAHKVDPNDIQPLLNLIDLYRVQDRYVEATQALKEALQLDPNHPELLVAFGTVSLELGDLEGGHMALKRLESISPDHPACAVLRQAMEQAGADLAREETLAGNKAI